MVDEVEKTKIAIKWLKYKSLFIDKSDGTKAAVSKKRSELIEQLRSGGIFRIPIGKKERIAFLIALRAFAVSEYVNSVAAEISTIATPLSRDINPKVISEPDTASSIDLLDGEEGDVGEAEPDDLSDESNDPVEVQNGEDSGDDTRSDSSSPDKGDDDNGSELSSLDEGGESEPEVKEKNREADGKEEEGEAEKDAGTVLPENETTRANEQNRNRHKASRKQVITRSNSLLKYLIR